MLAIIKQGLMKQLRQRKWVAFNALFPMFLMILLGSMLSGDNKISSDFNFNVSYYVNTEKCEFLDGLIDILEGENIKINKVETIEKGKEGVNSDGDIFLIIESPNQIKVYYSEASVIDGSILVSFLEGYSNTMASITEMYNIDPKTSEEILTDKDSLSDEIKTEFIKEEEAPNSYQYYGIVELTMMVFYVAMFPLGILGSDKRRMMKERISLAGVSELKYFIGRILSSFILSILILIPGFLFSIFVMKSKWGNYPAITFMYVLVFSFMMVTLGVVVGYLIKQRDKASLVLQGLIIPVLSFLGGSYVYLPQELNGIFNKITNISPLRWLNKGIFQVAYEGSYKYLNTSLIINVSLIFVLFIILYLGTRREKQA